MVGAGYGTYTYEYSKDTQDDFGKRQQRNTVVLDDTNRGFASGKDLIGQPSVNALARAVEEHVRKDFGNHYKHLTLTHGHLLNQSSPAASFKVHVDTEENIDLGNKYHKKPRTVMLTAVILLRKGNQSRRGHSGVRVHGAKSDALFESVGDCHIFVSDLWHESVDTFSEPIEDDVDRLHGDMKLTLFWSWT